MIKKTEIVVYIYIYSYQIQKHFLITKVFAKFKEVLVEMRWILTWFQQVYTHSPEPWRFLFGTGLGNSCNSAVWVFWDQLPATCVLEEGGSVVLDLPEGGNAFPFPTTHQLVSLPAVVVTDGVLWHKRTNVSRSCQFYIRPEDRWRSLLVPSCTAPHLGHTPYGREPIGKGSSRKRFWVLNHYVALHPHYIKKRGMKGR